MNILDAVRQQQAESIECAMCGRKGAEMCQCSCENEVYYCGTSCQHQHWAVHRPQCAARHNGGTLSSCVNCGLTSQTLKSCPCKSALYCSVKCQREHWGTHRRMCSNWVSTFRRPVKKKREAGAQTDVSVEEKLAEEKASRPPPPPRRRGSKASQQSSQLLTGNPPCGGNPEMGGNTANSTGGGGESEGGGKQATPPPEPSSEEVEPPSPATNSGGDVEAETANAQRRRSAEQTQEQPHDEKGSHQDPSAETEDQQAD